MNRLIPALSVVLLVAGCESTPTEPPPAREPVVTVPPQPPGPNVVPGTSIASGDTIREVIVADDPACHPSWDASGRCRQFDLTASQDGMLVATLKLTAPHKSEPDYDAEVFLVAPDWTTVYSQDAWPERHASLPAKSGLTYRIVVISYGPFPEAFELTVTVQP
jgi:hypothetical protein